jgi:spoIIIJ-associated protein
MTDSDDVEQPYAEKLKELLERLTEDLGLSAEVEVQEHDGEIVGSLQGDDLDLFIGGRGQTIDAVQHLAQRILFKGSRPDVRVVVDADGYRERRAATICDEANRAADRAVAEGGPVELEAMPPFERRTAHEHLRDRGDVDTHSEGEEPHRYLVVSPRE